MADAPEVRRARASDDAKNVITLVEEQFSEDLSLFDQQGGGAPRKRGRPRKRPL